MLSTHSLFQLLALSTLVSAASAQEAETVDLRFAPAVGTTLEKKWAYNHELLSEQMISAFDGERESIPAQLRIVGEHELVFIDQYQELGDGFPTRMRRVFTGGVRRSRLGPNGDPDKVGELTRGGLEFSLLNRCSVLLTWVPEEGGYGYCYDAQEHDESNLARLRGDTDLLALLPGRPVAVGDSWEVSPADLVDLLEPSGYVPVESTGRPLPRRLSRTLESGIGSRLGQLADAAHAGRVRVTLAGVREAGTERFADLSLEFDCRYVLDQLETVMAGRSRASVKAGVTFTEAKLTVDLEGTGTAVWNLSAGHVQNYSADLKQVVSQRLSQKQREGTPTRDQHLALTGTLTYSLAVTPTTVAPAPTEESGSAGGE